MYEIVKFHGQGLVQFISSSLEKVLEDVDGILSSSQELAVLCQMHGKLRRNVAIAPV